jgi:hypothetical protein
MAMDLGGRGAGRSPKRPFATLDAQVWDRCEPWGLSAGNAASPLYVSSPARGSDQPPRSPLPRATNARLFDCLATR